MIRRSQLLALLADRHDARDSVEFRLTSSDSLRTRATSDTRSLASSVYRLVVRVGLLASGSVH